MPPPMASGAARLAPRSRSLDVAASAASSSRRGGNRSSSSSSSVAPSPHGSPAFPLLFPGGGVWLDRAALQQDVVYGDSFVLTRPRRGGPGLVISPPVPPPSRSAQRAAAAAPVVRRPPPAGPPAARRPRARPSTPLLPGGPSAIEVTDYRIVGGEEAEEEAEGMEGEARVVFALPPPRPAAGGRATAAPAATATAARTPGPPPSPSAPIRVDIHAAAAAATPHPRRTARLAFTCAVCGARTTVSVNPRAWDDGAVFARCGGAGGAAIAEAVAGGRPHPPGGPCGVIHLLNDGAGIFHQLSGPVFSEAEAERLRRRLMDD